MSDSTSVLLSHADAVAVRHRLISSTAPLLPLERYRTVAFRLDTAQSAEFNGIPHAGSVIRNSRPTIVRERTGNNWGMVIECAGSRLFSRTTASSLNAIKTPLSL